MQETRSTERRENVLRQKILIMVALLSRSPWRVTAARLINLGNYVRKVGALLTKYTVHWPFRYQVTYALIIESVLRRSRWTRGLRRGCAASRLLGFRFRIQPGAWVSISCRCCVLSGRRLCWLLVQRSSTECGVSECDRKALIMWRLWPTEGCWGLLGAAAPW